MKSFTVLPMVLLLTVSIFAGQARCGQLSTFVSIQPQVEFVQRVGGDGVTVEVLLGQDQNPHSFDPSPRAVARLGEASLLFLAGVPYEEHLADRLAELFEGLAIVKTNAGISLRSIDHGHGHGDDPHTWLAPALAKVHAANICRALEAVRPESRQQYRAGLEAYLAELDSLDSEIGSLLEPYRGRSVYVYHPSFGYLLEAYGLHQEAVEHGGRQPSARDLAGLIERMRAAGVRTLFVQPEFPSPVADALSQTLGCRVVRLDPLATDYVSNMREIARQVAEALARQD
jgi:zinc transport system substrate-binding protein